MPRIMRSAVVTSWIDQHQRSRFPSPALGIEMPILESDSRSDANYTNSSSVTRELVVGETQYRFANLIECYIDVQNNAIIRHGFSPESGIYRSPSAFHLPSAVYETVRNTTPASSEVTFTQLVGCRTRSPEIAGAAACSALGGVPIGMLCESLAEAVTAFPPIWTEVSLTIRADGSFTQKLLAHSIFPSNCFFKWDGRSQNFSTYERLSLYNAWSGSTATLDRWYRDGWDSGNPWCIPNPRGFDLFARGGDVVSINPVEGQCRGSSRVRTSGTIGGSNTRGPSGI